MERLDKEVKINMCRDGVVTIRSIWNQERRLGSALPFHSTDTFDEARLLISTLCRAVTVEGDEDEPSYSAYQYPNCDGTLDSLWAASAEFQRVEKMIQEKR